MAATVSSEAGTPVPPTRGWVKVLLVLSLAVNLGIGGLFAGSYFAPPKSKSRHELGLGPFAEAMNREDWKAMRPAFMARNPDLNRGETALRADFDPVLAALRAEPFDKAALQSTLESIGQRNADRLASARQVIVDYLATLSPQARQDYADRVEAAMRKAKKPKRD